MEVGEIYLSTFSRVNLLHQLHCSFCVLLCIFGVLQTQLHNGQVAQSYGPEDVVVDLPAGFTSRCKQQLCALQVTETIIQRAQLQ